MITASDQRLHTINGMSIPVPNRLGACITDSNSSTLLYWGGSSDTSYSNSTYKYNFSTMEWTEIGSLPARAHGYRGARYKDTYWAFGVFSSAVPDGTIWIYNLTTENMTQITQLWYNYNNTNETQSENANNGYVPRVPGYTISNCASYDSDHHVFWITAGLNPPHGDNYTRVFNMTRFESGDYDNVWQYDIYGIPIDGTFWTHDIAPSRGGCMYDEGSPFVLGGIIDGVPERSIYRYGTCIYCMYVIVVRTE